jgi:ubiquinone/menaquinone biosynthesis C-methylase UbiE
MSQPISFDRAVDYYDATRGFPAGIAEQIAAALIGYTQNFDGAYPAHILEIGIGTGRIAAPCMAQGIKLTGIDLSWSMMDKFRQKLADEDAQFPFKAPDLAQADAARLPFADQSFDAVLAVHVLHLINKWREAVQESRRVTISGGRLIVGFDGRNPTSPLSILREKFDEILLANGVSQKRVIKRDFSDVDKYMLGQGCRINEFIAAEWSTRTSATADIEKLSQRIWSSTWDIPDDVYSASIAKIKEWAMETFGDLQEEHSASHRFIWKIYSWPKS